MKKNTSIVKVRYSETDQMGVVYHGNYAQYCEIGRTDWLRTLGVSYKDMETNGIMLPVISLNCNFIQPAYYDDELTIITTLKRKPTVKIEFDYEILNQNKTLICKGNTVLAFLNKETRRPTRCPKYILEKLEL